MPSADFAAAQERLAARRAQRAQRAHRDTQSTSSSSRAASRLPYPLDRVGGAGIRAWHAINGREGTRPEFRVGQVDAELLDEELLELLKGQVGEGLKYFGSHITGTYASEILLGLRLILFKLSIWNNNASYGAHLQGLRYTDARSTSSARPPPQPWQKAAYGLITIGGRYAWSKWENYLLSRSEDYTRPESATLTLASRLTEHINSLHDIASLASFLVFLVNGRYRTLTDRLLRLRLTPTSHATSREVSFEYLNRQLVWHAFTEFLLFLLPLVGISRWRRILSRTWRNLRSAFLSLIGRSPSNAGGAADDDESEKQGELGFLPERTCAICYRDQNPTTATEADVLTQSAGGGGVVGSAATDITNPYEAIPCGCIYCFACLAQRIANEEGEGWTCLRCGELVKECRPWNGDVLEEHRTGTGTGRDVQAGHTGKSVGFAALDGADNEGAGEDSSAVDTEKDGLLRNVDPIPEQDDEFPGTTAAQDVSNDLEGSRGFDLGDSLALSESQEWARASEDRSSSSGSSDGSGSESGSVTGDSDDEHSEEYDEEEDGEGEDLSYDEM